MLAIVGASGFIGSSVVEALSPQPKEFLAIDLVKPKTDCNWLIADIGEPATIERIFFEYAVDTVIHLIGLPQIALCEKDPHFSYLLNIQSVHNTLEAMRKTNVKRIIFASSAAVYGTQDKAASEEDLPSPNSIYGYHKYVSEKLIKAYSHSYGLDFLILRLFNVYGQDPQQGKDVVSIFLRQAKMGESLFVKGMNKYRDFVNIRDVVRVFIEASSTSASNRILNVGTGVKVTLGELVDLLKEVFPKIKVEHQATPDDGKGLVADIALCQKMFNFSPTSPYDGIRAYIKRHAK